MFSEHVCLCSPGTEAQRALMDYLIIILTRHDVGERDLCFEHLTTVHELNKQVADCLELHSFGRLNV